MYNYLIYDLRVRSYFFLEGISKEDFIGEADIFIDKERENTIVTHEKNMRTKGEAQIYFENEYLVLKYKNDWKITIFKSGDLILVDENSHNLSHGLSILLGTGLSILMMYRDRIPLHAAAFLVENYAVGMVGKSGVGKSTFLRYVLEKGHKVLTEDTLLICNRNDISVIPTRNIKSKLKKDAIDFFRIQPQYIGSYIKSSNKYWVEILRQNRCQEQKVLKRIYFLNPREDTVDISVKRIEEREQFKRLCENVNSLMDLPEKDVLKILKLLKEVSKKLITFELTYPLGKEHFEETLKKLIENEKECEEKNYGDV